MLTKVEVRTAQGVLFTLPLLDDENPYPVEGIDGLDPVKATLVFSNYARLNSSVYQSSRRENRNLIFKLNFNPDWAGGATVQSLRTNLYKFFMPQSKIRMRFFEDTGLTVDIAGIVESLDAPRFNKDPDVAISIVCENSDFLGLVPVTLAGNTTAGTEELIHEYAGSVDTGILFKMAVNRPINSFSLYHRPADDSQRVLEFAAPLLAGDLLEINTQPLSKGAWVTRAGVRSSILYGVSPTSDYVSLFPGANKLRVLATGADIPYTIELINRYGGL